MDSMITETMKEVMNNLAGQLIALVLIMGIAYVVTYFILGLIRVPGVLKNLFSTLAILVAIYFSFTEIFLV